MKRATSLMLAAICLVGFVVAQRVPISFEASHSPHAYLIKAEVQPGTQFKLYSIKLRPSGNHWTTVNSEGDNLVFSPALDAEALLFNEKHQGKHIMAYYGKTSTTERKHYYHHFTPAVVVVGEETTTFLLPLFTQDLPGFSTQSLFRCSNTLLSVWWSEGSAHLVVFSKHDPWSIKESIDKGVVNSEREIHYGKFVDEGHTHPIRVDLADNKYCMISQSTPATKIEVDPNQQFYDLDTILDMVGPSLPINGLPVAEEL